MEDILKQLSSWFITIAIVVSILISIVRGVRKMFQNYMDEADKDLPPTHAPQQARNTSRPVDNVVIPEDIRLFSQPDPYANKQAKRTFPTIGQHELVEDPGATDYMEEYAEDANLMEQAVVLREVLGPPRSLDPYRSPA